jgi:hypothetical protein
MSRLSRFLFVSSSDLSSLNNSSAPNLSIAESSFCEMRSQKKKEIKINRGNQETLRYI